MQKGAPLHKTHLTGNLAIHVQACETGMTHRARFLFFISTFKIFTDVVYSLASPWKMYQTKHTGVPQLQKYMCVTM